MGDRIGKESVVRPPSEVHRASSNSESRDVLLSAKREKGSKRGSDASAAAPVPRDRKMFLDRIETQTVSDAQLTR